VPKQPKIIATVLLIALPMCAFADAGLLDPTRPSFMNEVATSPSAEFSVTAIFFSDERQHAVVNGQVVARGDQVDGAKVVEIREDALDLIYRGESITRRLLTMKLRK
jgi:hypothetical protein